MRGAYWIAAAKFLEHFYARFKPRIIIILTENLLKLNIIMMSVIWLQRTMLWKLRREFEALSGSFLSVEKIRLCFLCEIFFLVEKKQFQQWVSRKTERKKWKSMMTGLMLWKSVKNMDLCSTQYPKCIYVEPLSSVFLTLPFLGWVSRIGFISLQR